MRTSLAKYRRDANPTSNHDHHAEPILPELKLPTGVTISRTALVCPRQLTLDEWKSLGCALKQFEGSIQWWLGDWWHYGFHRYRERKAMVTAKGTFGREYAFQTLMNYGYVAGKVETSRRREVLSFSHHVVVAALEPDQQERWLDIAVREKLSVAKLEQKMFYDEHPGGKFTEDEIIRHELTRLRRAAQIPMRFEPPLGRPPWERSELEQHLERFVLSPEFATFAWELDKVAAFWSKTAQFIRRIEAKSTRRAA